MSTSPLNNLSSSYLQSILGNALQDAGLTANKANASPFAQQPDNGRLSPFAQLISTLQQLQQSDPAKYQQVTQQIATNLQSAAQTAQSDGNATAANQLNQLATDFTNASTSGQLPNLQDLAQAISGGHHHHHHHAAPPDTTDASSANGSGASATTSQTLLQLLAALQGNGAQQGSGTQNDSLNPASIILNTLAQAGINGSNG